MYVSILYISTTLAIIYVIYIWIDICVCVLLQVSDVTGFRRFRGTRVWRGGGVRDREDRYRRARKTLTSIKSNDL